MAKREVEKWLKKEISEEERLNNYVKILEDSFEKLREAYEKKDSDEFNRMKKTIINLQKNILGNMGNERPE